MEGACSGRLGLVANGPARPVRVSKQTLPMVPPDGPLA